MRGWFALFAGVCLTCSGVTPAIRTGADLQRAIDACATAGGGEVAVPPGTLDLNATLTLRSNVTLRLDSTSELVFADSPAPYEDALVRAVNATNVAIVGEGVFRAQDEHWHHEVFAARGKRPRFFQFKNCTGVRFEGFRIRGSPMWMIHLLMSRDIVLRDIDAFARGHNTDGVDVDSCENVLIERCRLDQGDDGFVMKSGKNEEGRKRGMPTRHVTIRDCTVVNGHTLLGIGSELSGGIEDVHLENCRVEGEVWKVLYVKTNRDRGGYARNITVRNVTCQRAKVCAVGIGANYFSTGRATATDDRLLTEISDIRVENVTCEEGWQVVELVGDEKQPVKGVALRNVTMRNATRGYGTIRNVDGLVLDNVTAETGPFSAWCDDADAKYGRGQVAMFTIAAQTNAGVARVVLDDFGTNVLYSGTVDFAETPVATCSGTRQTPGFLRLKVALGKTTKTVGVAFDRTQISGGAEKPADFESFWRQAIADYDRKVPCDVTLEEKVPCQETASTEVWRLSLSDPFGRRIWGYLREPKDLRGRKYPVRVSVPGAGPCHGTVEGGDGARIDLCINVHYWKPIDGEKKRCARHNALQKAENETWSKRYPLAAGHRYCMCGIAESREAYYYYGSILAINRVVDWLMKRPEANAADFTYLGGSQGGGVGLALMALNGRFRKGVISTPALTGHRVSEIDGRLAGWPRLIECQLPENRAAAARNAPYFDGVHFASMISCPIAFVIGYIDETAPPHVGYAAFNACPAQGRMVFDSVGFAHSPSPVESGEARRWLDAKEPRSCPTPIANCTLPPR